MAAISEEVPLRLRYLPWVDAMVMAVHRDGVFFLPASEVLRRLGIASELQHSRQRLRGFYLRESTPYAIDLGSRIATLADRSVEVRDDEAFLGELDLFVVAALFERLFGWRITLDPLSLELRVEARESLPIATAAHRKESTAEPLPQDTTGMARFARRRQLITGGTVDYTVSAERSAAGERHLLDFLVGAQALGGEFQLRMHGADPLGSGFAAWPRDVRWRYVLETSALLSQMTVGRVFSPDGHAQPLHGLQITNHPVEPRTRFATHVVHGTTGAEWDVEIYVNERLVARTQADPFGRYRLEVPIAYGSASLRLRHLGPSGEVREEESRVEVPFTFLPPGRAAYTLTAGKYENASGQSAQADIGIGLTSWLTARSGLQYHRVAGDDVHSLSYHTISARLGQNRFVGAKIAPGAVAQVSTEWRLGSRAYFSGAYARYGHDTRLNPGRLAWEWSGAGYLPLRIRAMPVSFRVGGRSRANESGMRLTSVDAEAIAGIGPWVPSLGYRSGAAEASGEMRATSLFFVGRRLPPPLGNAVLRASYARPLHTVDTERLDVGVSTPLTKRHRLDLAYTGPPSSRLEVRLQIDGTAIRANTSIRRHSGDVSWSQSASGSIAIDVHRARATFSGRPLVGRGGVSIMFFLDENGNDRFDGGEERVPGARASFDRMAVLHSPQPGEIVATELLPYHRYHAHVDTRRVPNPLWRPQFASFTFTADPNKFQNIAVPFYAASAAQGTVVRKIAHSERPVAGLRVHVMSNNGSFADVISTFADGTFYHDGLRPGRYTVKLDAAQLDILGVTSEPSERTLEVQPNRDGATIEGLDFLLLPRNAHLSR